jgi:cell wall-associated NlpC family hydrolase
MAHEPSSPQGSHATDDVAGRITRHLTEVAAGQFDARTLLFQPRVLGAAEAGGPLRLTGRFWNRRMLAASISAGRAALARLAGVADGGDNAPLVEHSSGCFIGEEAVRAELVGDTCFVTIKEGEALRLGADAGSERITTAAAPRAALRDGRLPALLLRRSGGGGFGATGDWHLVQLPDGYIGYVAAAATEPLTVSAYMALVARRRVGSREEKLIAAARTWLGTPYAWGDCRPGVGVDCSAFTQHLLAEATGLRLPRDANMQVRIGGPAGLLANLADLAPGDLLFFMNDSLRVYHVGMSLGGDRFIQAHGQQGVIESSLTRGASGYDAKHAPDFLCARRLWW